VLQARQSPLDRIRHRVGVSGEPLAESSMNLVLRLQTSMYRHCSYPFVAFPAPSFAPTLHPPAVAPG